MNTHNGIADGRDLAGGAIAASAAMGEESRLVGFFGVTCIGPDGNVKWEDTAPNLVVNVGKNMALDMCLGGTAFVACYMGLANANATSCAATDTMITKTTWLEAGVANAPTYTGPRKTPSWSAAATGAKSTSSAVAFAITGTGTVGGCFIVMGTGAVTTIDSTAGTLYSCGQFTGGTKAVTNGDTLNVTYTGSM